MTASAPFEVGPLRRTRDGGDLGKGLDRYVAVSDGAFWFETHDFYHAVENAEAALKKQTFHPTRIEIWGRREHGSELCTRMYA